MPSPFPGMNPYLEQEYVWHDFHERCIPVVAETLNPQIVPRYFAKIDDHIYLHERSAAERLFVGRADVGIAPAADAGAALTGGSMSSAPAQVTLDLPVDEERQSFLEIRDRQNRQLITVVELLSPSNKRNGTDRDQYVAKRNRYIKSAVNLVEIDLLRAGPRMPMKDLAPCDYCVLVFRHPNWPRADVWPLRLTDPLPVIPVPLRPGEPEATLDLQAILHRIYDAAGYAYYIYDSPPEPPLTAAEAAWAAPLLPARP